MRQKSISVTLAPGASATFIAAAQTPGAAGNLTLAKTKTDTNGNAREIIVTTVSDESAKTITFTGRLFTFGPLVTLAIAGPNATTALLSSFFTEITQIAVSAAFTGNVSIGVTAIGSSQPVPVDRNIGQFALGQVLTVSATGSPNYTVQHTSFNVQSQDTAQTLPIWIDDATIAAKTGTTESALTIPVTAVRLKQNSGTGTGTLQLVQPGI